MVLLEAMAAVCPIIATDLGGISTVIKHGYNGSLIEPRKPVLIASEIIIIASHAAIQENYACRGKEIIKQRYSIDTMVRKYEQLYLQSETGANDPVEHNNAYHSMQNKRGNG
jgi:glycosyltransferase involved in cell wall biosynthesis